MPASLNCPESGFLLHAFEEGPHPGAVLRRTGTAVRCGDKWRGFAEINGVVRANELNRRIIALLANNLDDPSGRNGLSLVAVNGSL